MPPYSRTTEPASKLSKHALRQRLGSCVARTALLAAGSFITAAAWGGPTVSVAWENLDGENTPASAALTDNDGSTPLTAGSNGASDGAVIALGYFSGATSGTSFSGDWIPLTGPQAANIPFQGTRIGDSATEGGLPDGFFTLQTDFDSGNSAVYQNIPAPGTRLAIAVYNGTSIAASTHFNIATNDAWQWLAPDLILPTFVFVNPTAAGTQWLGGISTALRTAVPLASFPGNTTRTPARLINISTRGFVGTGEAQLIPGFVLQGTGSTALLVRAVGPTLDGFGVHGTLNDPMLEIFRQTDSARIASNDDWSSQSDPATVAAAFSSTGAFALASGSADAAVVATLPVSPGGYTVSIVGKNNTTGVALAEVYLLDTASANPTEVINISTRGFVGTGDQTLVPGFVIGPGGTRRLLIRVAGPTLGTSFGLSGVLEDPLFDVFTARTATQEPQRIASNDNWSDAGQAAAISAAAAQVGAFPLIANSKDAALILEVPAADLDRGFTVQIHGAAGTTGLVITEIYELP